MCEKCGTVSWVPGYEKLKLLYVQTILFWLLMIAPIYFGFVGWFFIIPAVILSGIIAFKFTIGRPNVKRLYGPPKNNT